MLEENLPQSEIDALLAAMKREAEKQRKYNRFYLYCAAIYISLVLISFIVLYYRPHSVSFIGLINIFNLIPQSIAIYLNSERRKKTVAELAKADDVRIVGALCDVLGFRDTEMANLAKETLTTLLPKLQSSDTPLLNSEQRGRLYGGLSGDNKPFVLATLKALEQIGDEKAISSVEKLADGKYLAKKNAEVQEAAVVCLPFLRERAAAQKEAQELLRASSPTTPTAELLRPATVGVTKPGELLRASGREIL